MITKMLEIRDRATCIPVMATLLSAEISCQSMVPEEDRPYTDYEIERAFLCRAGFRNSDMVYLVKLATGEGNYDPFKWNTFRTMLEAHLYIQKNWDKLKSGDVVDVEFILGESKEPKASEILVGRLMEP